MAKCKCKLCGYVYDSESGESRSKVDPGTDFKYLPESWCCPTCGAKKRMFKDI
ncbi:MAG: rubredoxin [Methanobacteriaceae archaeon]